METWSRTSLESPIPLQPESVISLTGELFILTFLWCLFAYLLLFWFIKLQFCLIVIFLFRIQKCQNALTSSVKMRIPHSNAFIDLNKDFTAGESAIFLRNLVTVNTGECSLLTACRKSVLIYIMDVIFQTFGAFLQIYDNFVIFVFFLHVISDFHENIFDRPLVKGPLSLFFLTFLSIFVYIYHYIHQYKLPFNKLII